MADEDLIIKLPEHANFNHRVTFNLEEAKNLLASTKEDPDSDPAVAFIMGLLMVLLSQLESLSLGFVVFAPRVAGIM